MDTDRYATNQKDAQRWGLYSYYTGKPCPQGHYSERYAHSRECIACHRTNYAEKPRRPPITITQRPTLAWAAGWAVPSRYVARWRDMPGFEAAPRGKRRSTSLS